MSELNIILNNVNRFTTSELESLVAKSPYFQQAHLLLAKKYQLEDNPKFDQQLQLAALYTRDRALLFELFREKDLSGSFTQQHTMAPVEEKQEETPIEQVIETEKEEQNYSPTITEPVEEVIETPPPPIEEITEEDIVEEKRVELTLIPLTPEEIVVPKLYPEDDVVLTIAVDRADEIPDTMYTPPLDEPLVRDTEDIRDEIPIGEEVLFTPEETLIEAEEAMQIAIAEEVQVPVVEVKPEEQFAVNEPHTFTEWLNAFAHQAPLAVEEPEPEPVAEAEPEVTQKVKAEEPIVAKRERKDELDTIIQENISSDYLHNIVQEETKYTKGLNRFIEEQKKNRKPAATAKKQVDDNELDPALITETMAKIYEMQKKYAKAIKAYEVLSLKFPEKSDLFAARINYLKNVI